MVLIGMLCLKVGVMKTMLDKSKSSHLIWITGLINSGKTSLSNALAENLRIHGKHVTLVEGDSVAEINLIENSENDYSISGRTQRTIKAAKLCKLLMQGNTIVIGSFVGGMFKGVDEWLTANVESKFTVFLNPPLDVLAKRDTKGLYGKQEFIPGIDQQVDIPDYDLELDSSTESVEVLVEKIIKEVGLFLNKK